MPIHKEYLGDGVYAALSEYGEIILTTETGIEITNRIYLADDILNTLIKFLAKHNKLTTSQKDEK